MQIMFNSNNSIYNKFSDIRTSDKKFLNAKVSFKADNSSLSTMDRLLEDKYIPKRRINEDGFLVTTIFNKKTGEPKETFVFCNKKEKDYESWSFFINENDIDDGDLSQVGYRSFNTNGIDNFAPGGFMESYNRYKYAGSGIREHQIALERMKALGINDIQIFSLAQAFPFHYKCGFRPITNTKNPTILNNNNLDDVISKYSLMWELPYEVIKSNISYKKINDTILINEQETKANIALSYYNNNLAVPHKMNVYMELKDEDTKKKWDELIKKEPILMQ